MLFKVVTAAIFAAVVVSNATQAQSIAQIGDPAETPPSSYSGAQYVDSRGCVFMRIVSNGRTSWYPRVNKARKVVCGMQPSLAPVVVAEATEAEAALPAATPVAAAPVLKPNVPPKSVAPVKTVASLLMPEARVVAAPSQAIAASQPGKRKIGCYTSAPVAELVRLRNGGTAVVCTRGDGGLTGWRPPVYPADAGVGAALQDTVRVAAAKRSVVEVPTVVASEQVEAVVVPKGYKLAWKDGRLNPKRGQGTAAGDAAQARIWTEETPARLVADVAKAKAKPARVTVSSKSSVGSVWVQIGSFGVVGNANGAAARLQALGLPVAQSQLSRGGKMLLNVMTGPFGSGAEAQMALQAARQAGFADAFIR